MTDGGTTLTFKNLMALNPSMGSDSILYLVGICANGSYTKYKSLGHQAQRVLSYTNAYI